MSDNESLKIELLKACGGDVEAAALAFEWVRPTHTVIAPVSLKPATKTVEVWRVEYAHKTAPLCRQFNHPELAEAEAARLKDLAWEGYGCIHVTGPHKQTVPAT